MMFINLVLDRDFVSRNPPREMDDVICASARKMVHNDKKVCQNTVETSLLETYQY